MSIRSPEQLAVLAALDDDHPDRLAAEGELLNQRDAGWSMVALHDRLIGLRGRPAGVVQTPRWLAVMMARLAKQYLRTTPRRLLEPGCGPGSLLLGAAEVFGPGVLSKAAAYEVDAATAAVARRVLGTITPSVAVVAADFLAQGPTEPVDLVLANPPYAFGESVSRKKRSEIKTLYPGQGAQVDLFRPFVLAALTALRPGGVAVLLLPDAILARDELAELRAEILRRAVVCEVRRHGPCFSTPEAGRLGVGGVTLVLEAGHDTTRRSFASSFAGDETVTSTTQLPTESLRPIGSPWPVTAPPWWLGQQGLRTRLLASGSTVDDVLLAGAAGATRGEEYGRRRLRAVATVRHEPVLAGSDIRRLRPPAPSAFIASRDVRKARRHYAGPRVLVVKTGQTPVATFDSDDVVALQSVYLLHLAPSSPWTHGALAAALCSCWLGAFAYCEWTSLKAVHPQLTLGNLRSLPLPPLGKENLQRLTNLAELTICADDPTQRAEYELAVDELIGDSFGLDRRTWAPRLADMYQAVPTSQKSTWL